MLSSSATNTTREAGLVQPEGLSAEVITQLKNIVGDTNLTTDEKQLVSGSRDCYHFSPVLVPQLEGRYAEVIVRPQTQAQLKALIACAVTHRIPITPRGAGTGNYGQGVPLHGGILVNTRDLKRLVAISADSATVEAGFILYDIEKAAAGFGAELRIFPSTVPTSSTGGFISGGSGGVGSIEWGMLREADNVRSVRILTIEPEPRDLLISGTELERVLHNCGLTAFVTEVTLALAPKTAWHQYVLAFDDLTSALDAARALAEDDGLRKRLVTAFEWPIPSFFKPLVKQGACPEGASAVFLYTDEAPERVTARATRLGGRITFHQAPSGVTARGTQIYDYAWNHTTQWAMKADASLTYLQDRFELDRLHEQIRLRKARFPGELIEHVEFVRAGGAIVCGGLSIVRYRDRDRLAEIIDYCESIDVRVANPHTYFLDDDSRWYGEAFLAAKREWDPGMLLNPGHLRALGDVV